MNTISTILCIVIVVVAVTLYLITKKKLKEAMKANLEFAIQHSDMLSELLSYKILLKVVTEELLDAEGYIKPNTFPFKSFDPIQFKNENLDSIRFKKKGDNVLVYVNGIVNPSLSNLYIQEVTCLDRNTRQQLVDINKFLCDVQITNTKSMEVLKYLQTKKETK